MFHKNLKSHVTLAIAVLLSAVVQSLGQVQYTVTEIGTLGNRTTAFDVNNFGHVVGVSETPAGDFHPFVFANGTMTDLFTVGNLGGTEGVAYAINDNGVIVGNAMDSNGIRHAVRWSGGVITDLGSLPGGSSGSAFDIAENGTIVGWSLVGSNLRAFQWKLLTGMTELGTLGGLQGQAFGISDTGIIVGQAESSGAAVMKACRFSLAGNSPLPVPLPGFSFASDVSNNGVAVGGYNNMAAKWIGTNRVDLESLGGGSFGAAEGINSMNQIVGESGLDYASRKAVIWNNTVAPVNLNTLVPAGATSTLRAAFAINDSGQIVASDEDPLNERSFILSPLVVQILDPVEMPGFLGGGSVSSNLDTLGQGQSSGVIGMCCDGATRVVLRVGGLAHNGSVVFQISDENGDTANVGDLRLPGQTQQGSASLVAQVSTLSNGQKMAFAVLHAPNDFVRGPSDIPLITRPVNLHVTYIPSGSGDSVVANREILLHRPPLLLLHGLNSSSDTWQLSVQTDSRFLVYRGDYRATAGNRFADNVIRAAGETKETIRKMKALGYACVQADVVGHSMGGLLSRLYIANYDGIGYRENTNFGEGSINRLITLDTPHFGSKVADVAVGIRDGMVALNPLLAPYVVDLVNEHIGSIDGGAVDDLRPDSYILTHLPPANVPAHAIVSTGGSDIISQGLIGVLPAPTQSVLSLFAKLGQPMSSIFPPPLEHDLIVGRLSQEGGLTGTQTTVVGYSSPPMVLAIHFTNTHEGVFSNRIVSLLNTVKTDASIFAPGGFPAPGGLASGTGPQIPTYGPLVNGLVLTLPTNTITVHPGDVIQVTGESINGFSPTGVAVSTPFGVTVIQSAPYSASITVPPTFIGDFNLRLLAVDANWAVAVTPPLLVHVTIPSGVTLTSLSVRPEPPLSLFAVMPHRQVTVIGLFSDGVERDITLPAFGTSYEIVNHRIAEVDSNGVITSASVGETTLNVWNGSVTVAAPVIVDRIPCPADITDDTLVNIDDLVLVITSWGNCTWCPADITKNGTVDIDDLVIVITNWGSCQ